MEAELKHIEALSFEEHSKIHKSNIEFLTMKELIEKYGEHFSEEDKEEILKLDKPIKSM